MYPALDQSSLVHDQHFRWLCNSYGTVSVMRVNLIGVEDSGTSDNGCEFKEDVEGGPDEPPPTYTFGDVICSLQNQIAWGLGPMDYRADCGTCDPNAINRVYHVFLDDGTRVPDPEGKYPDYTVSYPAGGQAAVAIDDRPGSDSPHNVGAKYSMNFNWDGHALVHEVIHNVGAVMPSAPHYHELHCTDEHDVMCEQAPTVVLCGSRPDWKLDCNQDDYWKPLGQIMSGDGSREIWNTTNSVFLSRPTYCGANGGRC
ncbi:MAG: hypothetical protein ABR613_09050 [Actinomycetota bacterium]